MNILIHISFDQNINFLSFNVIFLFVTKKKKHFTDIENSPVVRGLQSDVKSLKESLKNMLKTAEKDKKENIKIKEAVTTLVGIN